MFVLLNFREDGTRKLDSKKVYKVGIKNNNIKHTL